MTCASCAARIEKKLNRMDGVTATVNYATEKAKVSYGGGVSVPELIATVEATGYTAREPEPVRAEPASGPEPAQAADELRPLRERLVTVVVLAVPVIARPAGRACVRRFVDGYDWVMIPNVIGMSQYADAGRMTTKPYTSGGAYVHRMSDLCGPCRYRPVDRTGEQACPYTAGYWTLLDRHRERLGHNHRTAQPVRQLQRLHDLDEVRGQEQTRGDAPP